MTYSNSSSFGGGGVGVTSAYVVGSIQQSMLDVADFQAEMGTTDWVLCDGSDITGSALAAYIGNTLPDATGRFLRTAGGSAAAMRTGQAGDTASHNHGVQVSVNDTGSIPGYVGTTGLKTAYTSSINSTGTKDALYVATSTGTSSVYGRNALTTATSGGTETRPINITVNTFIKIN